MDAKGIISPYQIIEVQAAGERGRPRRGRDKGDSVTFTKASESKVDNVSIANGGGT